MNVIQQFNERYKQALEITPMITDRIDSVWFRTAKAALCLASPISLGISPDEFYSLYHKALNQLTLMDFSILSNNVESKSAQDLNMPIEAYLVFIRDNAKHVEEWNSCAKILRSDIERGLALDALKAKGASQEQIGEFIAKTAQA